MSYDIYAPGDPTLAPGEARCPGPSTQDLIASDSRGLPAPLRAQRYEFLGDEDVPFSRYTSEAFHQREIEHVWARTWQWACREEHIPGVGDYTVYDIDRFSIIVIREARDRIRAYVNSCPHRGMGFFEADSCGTGKQFIRCPFHGMSWNLDGSLREIPCRWDFPHVDDKTFRLTEVACATWGGFVFVNLDRDCESLESFLEVLPEHFRETPLQDRYVSLHTRKILPGNWKMAMEGFLEAFHVLATHPEGLHTSAWANTQYDIFGRHVTRFLQPLASGNPQDKRPLSEPELFRAMGHDAVELPPGRTARAEHAEILRKTLGERIGVDLSDVSDSLMLDSIEYHLFPNACFFPGINIPLIYRFRPLGFDRCIHDIMLLQPVPDHGPRPAPAEPVRLGIDDSYTTVPNFGFLGPVLDQDTENFRRQWAGMRTSLKHGQTLGNYQESRIRRFHRTLDEYLGNG